VAGRVRAFMALTTEGDMGSAPDRVRATRRIHPRGRTQGPWFMEFYASAIGKKAVMALTGIVGMGFVLAHMVGNLKIYTGENAEGVPHINEYGEWLRALGEPALPNSAALWIMRGVLIAAVLLHIHAAVTLSMMNRRARPVGYKGGRSYILGGTYVARSMRITGILLVAFIVFHLFDLTWGPANPDFQRGEVFHNVTQSLSRWWVAAIYIAGNLALGLHLWHGVWSLFQSLGWNSPRFNLWRRYFAYGFTLLVVGANLTFPIVILADWV
jgi:succinate dehydrogenase / fumarate reductase, cytochrome b subunit